MRRQREKTTQNVHSDERGSAKRSKCRKGNVSKLLDQRNEKKQDKERQKGVAWSKKVCLSP